MKFEDLIEETLKNLNDTENLNEDISALFIISEEDEEYKDIFILDDTPIIDTNEIENITESIKKKWVIRKGMKIKKYYSTKEGFKIIYKKGKPREVKILAKEKMARKKAARKRKSKHIKVKSSTKLQRLRSLKKSQRLN